MMYPYHQSSGHAEAAVKSVKHLTLKVARNGNTDSEAFERGHLDIRNMPRVDGRSPAQILYGYSLRSCAPAHAKSFALEWQVKAENCKRHAVSLQEATTAQYNSHPRKLPHFKLDSHTRIQDPLAKRWDRLGVVMSPVR